MIISMRVTVVPQAMCVWYNTALHLRQKMVSLRRMLRSASLARVARASHPRPHRLHPLASSDSDLSG